MLAISEHRVIKSSQLTLSSHVARPKEATLLNTTPQYFALPATGIDLDGLEQQLVRQALEKTGGNVSKAAKLLGVSRDTLRYRMEKYQLHTI